MKEKTEDHKIKEKIDVVNIGKKGLTDELVSEIRDRLEKKKMVKVRILRTALSEDVDRRNLALQVSVKCRAKLADVRGNTFILEKI